jgi:hypothetical protein
LHRSTPTSGRGDEFVGTPNAALNVVVVSGVVAVVAGDGRSVTTF